MAQAEMATEGQVDRQDWTICTGLSEHEEKTASTSSQGQPSWEQYFLPPCFQHHHTIRCQQSPAAPNTNTLPAGITSGWSALKPLMSGVFLSLIINADGDRKVRLGGSTLRNKMAGKLSHSGFLLRAVLDSASIITTGERNVCICPLTLATQLPSCLVCRVQ
ncbi:unnamed protein product [Phytophthora lilii]|uniref:Unnamed protein product n=1 Tax=Phytophthora lilii TaxID=2077276 RepID=A0A9W6TD77_9STRA|nr:unnamed protein product [Phytophthora lilii]